MLVSTHLVHDPADVAGLPATRDSARTLVVVFGPPDGDRVAPVVSAIGEAFPRSVVTGCSTAGAILDRRVHDRGFSVAVARFDSVELASASAEVGAPEHSRRAAEELAAQVTQSGLRAVVVFSDGLHLNGSELVRGFNAVLPSGVVVVGGLAGDGRRFARTWVLHDRRPVECRAVAVGLCGAACAIGRGSRGGWDAFGPERLVTRADGPVLYELDGRPALELYRSYLGALATGLPAAGQLYPLSFRADAPGGDRLVRSVVAVDEARQAVVFAGDVPQGGRGQLLRASADRLVQGASQAAYQSAGPGAGPWLALAVSGAGRRFALGERVEEELDATLDSLPAATSQIGFYAYGEISTDAAGTCHLHSQTMTLSIIGEAA